MARQSVQDLPFLVVGAGIGGLSTALGLGRAGLAAHVLEQANALQEIGAGIQLGPNVFRMLDLLGVKDAVARHSVFPDRYQILDAITGEELTHLPLGEACIERFGYPYGVTHRHDLHKALVDAVRGKNVPITLGCRIVEFVDDGKHVTAVAEDGRAFRGAALIGADGIRSRIREILKEGEKDPLSPGLMAARAIPSIEAVPEDVRAHRITIWLGPKSHTIYYPLRNGTILNLASVFEIDHGQDMDAWDMQSEVQRVYAGQHPTVCKLLPLLQERRYAAGTERVPMKEWSRGRVTLLGDAAHAMTQNLAQGGAMAVEDAVVLIDKLLEAEDICEAFVAYQEARYLRTARVQLSARYYGDVLHMAGAERDLRNTMMKALDPGKNLEVFDWLYQGPDISGATKRRLKMGLAAPSPT